MNWQLDGKVAIVSGGSKGIGFAIARLLLAEGCSVTIASRTQQSLDSALETLEADAPGRVGAVAADMTADDEVRRVVAEARERFGPADIAVSNVSGHVIDKTAAGPHAGHFMDVPPEGYRQEFEQLFMSAWSLARAVIPDMKARGFGRILNIGSGVAREPTWELPHILPNAVRPAVAGLYRTLAVELSPFGITVNNILTGSIATDRNVAYTSWLAQECGVDREQVVKDMHRTQPICRAGTPEEMAALAGFLCSGVAGQISGQSIPVSGGRARHIY
jgi:3-oxoacyl-[acyl-carrier protein] reductase